MAKVILKENFKLRDNHDKGVIYTSTTNSETGKVTHHYEYFACTCSDESKKYWKDKLISEFPDHDPEKHADFTSQLAMEIAHTFNGDISIGADMWFGISSTCYFWDDENDDEDVSVHMQCDEIAIGLLAIVEVLRKVTGNV